jgi:hypothetical protein
MNYESFVILFFLMKMIHNEYYVTSIYLPSTTVKKQEAKEKKETYIELKIKSYFPFSY